jgi:hypothetical protein
MVYLRCKLPETLGGVRVNGKFNVCAVVNESVVKPLQTSVGNNIELSAMGEDAEGDNIRYIWSGTGGDIDDPNAMDTIYTCEEAGKQTVTIRVSDDGFEYCMDEWTTVVTCVGGDGNPCDGIVCEPDGNECTVSECDPSDGMCKDEDVDNGTDCKNGDGTCLDGECVDIDRCEDVNCDDDEECTDNECNPLTGNCINDPVDDGTDCDADGGAGMCVDGDCMAKDLCDGVTCEDTGNECTVGVCNMQTGNCDPMDVPDSTECNAGAGACSAGECIDNNLCDGVDCSAAAQCVEDGTCDAADGSCIPGANRPADTSCDEDGGTVCDETGNCVECNSAGQCADDGNECTVATCASNECGSTNVGDGANCDFNGGEGICEGGTCVEKPECSLPSECDDLNECTTNECALGMCEFPPNDGADCDASGLPGLCEAGACIGLCEGVNCPDLGECMVNECKPQNGDCEGSPVDDGTPCDGGTGECDAGACVPTDLCQGEDCSDGDECTQDLCDSGTGVCSNPSEPVGTLCGNDGQCTSDDPPVCTEGACTDQTGYCVGDTALPCADDYQCAAGTCSVSALACHADADCGVCVFAGTQCSGDFMCTDFGDSCTASTETCNGADTCDVSGSNSAFICGPPGTQIKNILTGCGVCAGGLGDCPPNCFGAPQNPALGAAACTAGSLLRTPEGACPSGLDSACLGCYGLSVDCGSAAGPPGGCLNACSDLTPGSIDGPNGCNCIDCITTECDPAFAACSGFPNGSPAGDPNAHPTSVGGPPVCEAVPAVDCNN